MQGPGPEMFVGIDVSKARLDVADEGAAPFAAENTPEGIAGLVARIAPMRPTLVVLEATGELEVPAVAALAAAGLAVAGVNPRQVRDFDKATGELTKTDAIDAADLAHFARAIRPEVRPLSDEAARELDALLDRRRQLVGMRTMERNRHAAGATGRVRRDLESHLGWLDEHIAEVD